MKKSPVFALVLALLALGCTAPDEVGDGPDDAFPTGKGDGAIEEGSAEALAVLALVNGPSVDVQELDIDAALNRRAAENIIEHRDGPDGHAGTADDDLFDSLAELDGVSFVGPKALAALLDYARDKGLLAGGPMDVIMSPQPSASSHNARIVDMIKSADESIDIAIYSFSQADISEALEEAVNDGIAVRFIFETARAKDRKLEGDALLGSKSGRLEQMGIDVRWVNKIMHHKFLIVDGPRDDADAASTASIASGSANWNAGGARFDENTLFFSGNAELALRMQREFNLMWHNSRDLEIVTGFEFDASSLEITDSMIADADDPDADLLVTSDNYSVTNTTFRTKERNSVASELVEAIENADSSILIASGHLRSRPVSEALIAKAQAEPDLDIRVYLDGQEYISPFTHDEQVEKVEDCLANATTETKERDCLARGFLFGFQVGETPGIDVRYKYYAYRWDHSYATQMHHKYIVIDGDELYSGSYNFSDNAEHSSFENVFVLKGAKYQAVIDQFVQNFETIWETERDGALEDLTEQVESGDSFPIVFEPMALTHSQVRSLKSSIIDACPAVNSAEFRQNASAHRFCDPNQ